MDIRLAGINYESAPVDVRETVALPGDLTTRLLHVIREREVADEALVLNTCNRTEFYLVGPICETPFAHLIEQVTEMKGATEPADLSHFYRSSGMDVVRHLFRVAASLDSQIVGEHEILGQLKEAYRESLHERTAHFFLNRLMHRAFRTGKRVRASTKLCDGAASVAGAAVQKARESAGTCEGQTVLLVGAGDTAEIAARSLLEQGAARIIVANRTVARARRLCRRLARPDDAPEPNPVPEHHLSMHADDQCPLQDPDAYPAEAVPLDDLETVLPAADVVICSTGSADPLLDERTMQAACEKDNKLCIIDIAVPRDVDPAVAELEGVSLHNIDDLESVVQQNRDKRKDQIPRAEAIVEEEVDRFGHWLDSRQVVPTIKALRRHFDRKREATLAQLPDDLPREERERLREFGERLCNKLLHDPLEHLHDVARKRPELEVLNITDNARNLFDLEEEE
ncbi:MAG: glutamyl-tRNA reductase [Candidatus Brocadiia bacterium]